MSSTGENYYYHLSFHPKPKQKNIILVTDKWYTRNMKNTWYIILVYESRIQNKWFVSIRVNSTSWSSLSLPAWRHKQGCDVFILTSKIRTAAPKDSSRELRNCKMRFGFEIERHWHSSRPHINVDADPLVAGHLWKRDHPLDDEDMLGARLCSLCIPEWWLLRCPWW